MLQGIRREPYKGNRGKFTEINLRLEKNKDWVVWWYGGLLKNNKADSVPLVVVFFRLINDNSIEDKIVSTSLALTFLGQLTIGSIWRNGLRQDQVVLESERFDVNFSSEGWQYNCNWDATVTQSELPLPYAEYPLMHELDRNWLLEFPFDDGKNLLIPCLEFYSRCYGRSEEIVRVLATYPWSEAQRRLYVPFDQPVRPGTWPVKLAKRLLSSDIKIVGHLQYDAYTQNIAKSIYSQIESLFNRNNNIAFIKVGPWHTGPAKLWVKGLWVNDNQTFLGLRILGCSDPKGLPIQRDRENYNKTHQPSQSDDGEKSWNDVPMPVYEKLPDIIDLTSDYEPDHGSANLELMDPDFVVLGEPRKVIDVWRKEAKNQPGQKYIDEESSRFSSGETYGTGKQTGYSMIHAREKMETEGLLKDMWNALVALKEGHPDQVQSVEWFTFEDGFQHDSEPILIGLQTFTEVDELEVKKEIKKWVYCDYKNKIPRGVVVFRVKINGTEIFIMEIQRKIKASDIGDEDAKSSESYKGFIFTLDDQSQLVSWLRELLSKIRFVKGVFHKIAHLVPGKAAVFKHVPASYETIAREAAVRNALRKLGIKL